MLQGKKMLFPGQVDYEWVKDKVEMWCTQINESDFNEGGREISIGKVEYIDLTTYLE